MAHTGGRWNTIKKQHTCVGCGCVFSYSIDLRDPGYALMRSLTPRTKNMVATHPCPGCGLIQPEMVMWSKVCHPMTTLLALAALIAFGALGTIPGGPAPATCALFAIAAFATLALIHFATALANPNRDLAANLERASKEVEAGKVELVSAAPPEYQGRRPRNLSLLHLPALLLLLAGPLAFIAPATALGEVPAPPTNPGLNPSVIMPGDRVSFTFPNVKAQGVTGQIWRGKPTVRVINASVLGIRQTLAAEGREHNWGKRFTVAVGSSNRPLDVTIHFTVPKDAKLAGKTLKLTISMTVTYPAAHLGGWPGTSGRFFIDQTATLTEHLVVKVANPDQVSESRETYLIGMAGAGLFLVGSLWLSILASLLQLRASPSEVLSGPPEPQAAVLVAEPVPLPGDDVRSKVGPIDFRRRPIG